MATHLERVIQMLLHMQSGQPIDGDVLAAEMGVHRRTIFRDMALLRDLGLPIERDAAGRHWLPKMMADDGVTTAELTELLAAAALTCLPETSRVREALTKLTRRLPVSEKREVVRLLRAFVRPVPADSLLDEPALLMIVIQAIRQSKGVALQVDADDLGNRITLLARPLRLSLESGGWQLAALTLPDHREQHIRLRTVRQARLTDELISVRLRPLQPEAPAPPELETTSDEAENSATVHYSR